MPYLFTWRWSRGDWIKGLRIFYSKSVCLPLFSSQLLICFPDECWESVFKLLDHHHHRYLESLSLVCKQFLYITNRLRSSLTICDPARPYLPRLFTRFPALTSLDLSRCQGDLHALFHQISLSPPPHLTQLHSLNISKCKIVWAQKMEELPLGEAKSNLSCFSLLKMILEHFGLVPRHRVRYITMPLHIIGKCFPFLEELDISFLMGSFSDIDVKALSLALPKLRKVNLSGISFINNSSFFDLCKNCEFLEEVIIFRCQFISCDGVASAIKMRPNLTSLSFSVARTFTARLSAEFISSLVSLKSLTCIELQYSTISDEMLFSIAKEGLPLRKLLLKGCSNYSYAGILCLLSKCNLVQHMDLQSAVFLEDKHISKLTVFLANLMSINLSYCTKLTNLSFFALTGHCPLLSEINMVRASMGGSGVEDSLMMDLVVNSQMKSLRLADNQRLRDEDIKIFAFICPNLQLLNLRSCPGISKGVVEVLKICPKIRHLSLAGNSGVKQLFGMMNFQVPMLEVLNLSYSSIDDEALRIISQSFCWLLHLEMKYCSEITGEGIRQVVENCKQLREINLEGCHQVDANVVDWNWMVFSRPSLRKIWTPLSNSVCESQRKFFLLHGCIVSEYYHLKNKAEC